MSGRLDPVFKSTQIAGTLCLRPFFRLQVKGAENVPSAKAFVLLPKHQRWEDIPLLGLSSPRALYYVAKYELFKNPAAKWFLRSLGGIPLNRERPLESRPFLRETIGLLKRGEGIVVFPEGTYYPGRMGPANLGIIRLISSRVEVPFIPAGIKYERKGRRWRVNIQFGKPCYQVPGGSIREFMEFAMDEIARLSNLK